ncbi:MAG: aminoglycoside phosphotransferase family protein [Actinomycetota bacterium]|nr:aminoglycoside phosphotransferase family protein [Actinomycetota bacterium]
MREDLRVKRSDVKGVGTPVAQRWLDCHGQEARAWLDHLPDLARWWAQRWDLVVGEPLAGGSVSVVYSVECKDGPAVLKLAAPWSRWSRGEAAALQTWDGHGAIRLLAASDDAGALLLERAWPGRPANDMTAAEFAALLSKLTRPAVPSEMPSLVDAVHLRFDRAEENRHGLLSPEQILRARYAAVGLAETQQGSSILCHGDLSSKNVLVSHNRGLLAIDPNPCAGHPAYDAAQWAVTQTPVAQTPQRATAAAAALGISADDVLRWVCVLTAVEACLASLNRAQASLELARRYRAEWFLDG